MKKYRASKLTVKHVDPKTEKDFLNANHKQGTINSTVAIGLFDGDELIQIETFGQPRIEIQNKNIQHQWELLRECSRKDVQVYGGKSRILKHFIQEYHPVNLLSYCSLTEGFDGHSYQACGFTKLSESGSYHYEYQGQKIQRYKMQKNSNLRAKGLLEPIEKTLKSFGKDYDSNLTELENALQAGFQKVNDIGNQVWEMNFAKYIGYVYEFELEGKKYRGKHILNGRPYFGSGTAWKAWCNSIPNYRRKVGIKILEWVTDESLDELDKKLTEVETKYILEILGKDEYLNISDNTLASFYVKCHNPISNARRAKTIANRTPERKEEISRKFRETMSNKTPEEKEEIKRKMSRKRLENIANRTSEEKEKFKRKMQKVWSSRTTEEKDEISKRISQVLLNKTSEQKEDALKKARETIANWSDDKKAQVSKHRSEAQLNMSAEAKVEKIRKMSETRAKWSDDKKAQVSKHRSEAQLNMNPEAKVEMFRKRKETIANWSQEKKDEITLKRVKAGKKSTGIAKKLYNSLKEKYNFSWNEFQKLFSTCNYNEDILKSKLSG